MIHNGYEAELSPETAFGSPDGNIVFTFPEGLPDDSCHYHNAATCPDCGAGMVRQGSCFSCPLCGFGACG